MSIDKTAKEEAGKAFETWVFNGLRFLAFTKGDGVIVIDESGRAYGGWMTIDNFRKRQRDGDELASPMNIHCRLFMTTRQIESGVSQ